MNKLDVEVQINGDLRRIAVEPRMTLLDFVRDIVGLSGTHTGCEHGVCGACSILLDGAPVRASLMEAVQADGSRITTVEGLCNSDGTPGILQDAFIEAHGMQCGYCTPGLVVRCSQLPPGLKTRDQVRWALAGNFCRCTGYTGVVESVIDQLGR